MKKAIAVFAFTIMFVAGAAYADLVTVVEINIVNDTGAMIDKIEVSPDYRPDSWIEVPISTWVIREGETYRMQFREFVGYNTDIFNVRLRDSQGRYYTLRNQDLPHTSTMRFSTAQRN